MVPVSELSTTIDATLDLIRSICPELVIFFVTVCVSMAFQAASRQARMFAKGSKGGKACAMPSDSVPRRPSAAGRGAAGSGAAAGAASPLQRGWLSTQDLASSLVTLASVSPGARHAGPALHRYSELRSSLGLQRGRAVGRGRGTMAASGLEGIMRRSGHKMIDVYTILVQCAVRSGQCHLIDRLLADMQALDVPRPVDFYEVTMKQLASQKQYHMALDVYDRMCVDGLEPSAVTRSCLVSFAAEVGELGRAVSFFKKLSETTTPSIRAYMTILRVYTKQLDWSSSVAALRDMEQRGVKVDTLVFNILLSTGVAADQLDDVDRLLREYDTAEPRITDIVSYNTLIKGYARRGDADAAARLVARARGAGLTLTPITFNSWMDGVVRCTNGCDRSIWDVVEEMRCAGMKPDKFTCSIVVKGISKDRSTHNIVAAMKWLRDVGDTWESSLRQSLYAAVHEAALDASDTVLVTQVKMQMAQQGVPSSGEARLPSRAC